MNNSLIPNIKVDEKGNILNKDELLKVIKNTNVESLTELEFKEFENLYQTLSNDNNSENKYTNEEEIVSALSSVCMNYKVLNEKQNVTSEELLQTIKGNKDDAINLDVVKTKGIENDSGKDITYLTVKRADGSRDILEVTNDDVLKQYLAGHANDLNDLTSEELFDEIKNHVFKNLKFEDKMVLDEDQKMKSSKSDNYIEEMEEKEIHDMITKFGYDIHYKKAVDSNGERLYIVNGDIYKFKNETNGKRTIYPIVKSSSTITMHFDENENEELTEEELQQKAKEKVEDINKQKEDAKSKEADTVKSSFETKPVEHNYSYNNDQYLGLNNRVYYEQRTVEEDIYEPNFKVLDEEEMNIFYFDTNALLSRLPDIVIKNIQTENINNAVKYATNFAKFIKRKSRDELNDNELRILDTYETSMQRIEEYYNSLEVDEKVEETVSDDYDDDLDSPAMVAGAKPPVEQEKKHEEVKEEEKLEEKIENEEGGPSLDEVVEEQYNQENASLDDTIEEQYVSDAPDVSDSYYHPLPGKNNHRARTLTQSGTHGVALVLILLEIIAISVLAVVFYNMMQ